jgi:hypothetical protein
MKAIVASALLGCFILLAGCSGGDPRSARDAATDAVLEVPEPTVDAGSGSGAMAGVVVDEAIRPVPGADVRAEGHFNVTTDTGGRFVVEGLEPGNYLVHVTADGFLPMQTGVEVTAGDATTVRLLLTRDLSPRPYNFTYHFTGYTKLWLGQKAIEDKAPGTTECTCTFEMIPDGIVKTWVLDADGTYTLENPNPNQNVVPAKGTLAWYLTSTEGKGRSGQGNFPVWMHAKGDLFDNSTGTYTVRLHGANWPAGEIHYELYVTAFYVQAPPDDWSFLAGK